MADLQSICPEVRDLINHSATANEGKLPEDIKSFLLHICQLSEMLEVNTPAEAVPQPGSYNPEKTGTAYYFNESGSTLRKVHQFSMDDDQKSKKKADHDDQTEEFERCNKFFSKVDTSSPFTSTLFLWFCADHGHCYGFHMTTNEGRKDPSPSLYSYLETPPDDVFYDFACGLQEYCLNRESGYYKDVRFFHDIFHGYSHKCSSAYKSSRLQGFESVNSEVCEQFNTYLQCIKKSARQMTMSHFCCYVQFFLHAWSEKKKNTYQRKLNVALKGSD